MKRILTILTLVATVLCGCQHNDKAAEPAKGLQKVSNAPGTTARKKQPIGHSLLPQAGGAPYELLVIMDNAQWERPVGRALFEVLDTDLPGVAQSERQFRMSRIDPSSFRKMYKIFRNIILLDVQDIYSTAKIKFSRDVYARDQMIITLQAHDEQQLAEHLQKYGTQILDLFTKAEFNRGMRDGKNGVEKEIEKAEAARRNIKKPVSVGGAGSKRQNNAGQSNGGTFSGDSNVDTDF